MRDVVLRWDRRDLTYEVSKRSGGTRKAGEGRWTARRVTVRD